MSEQLSLNLSQLMVCLNQFPDDICDEDNLQELRPVSSRRTIADRSYVGSPMDQHTAMVGDFGLCFFGNGRTASLLSFDVLSLPVFLIYQELKMVLLGSGLSCFTVEWRNQGFTFSETHNLRYGFEQKKVVTMMLFC